MSRGSADHRPCCSLLLSLFGGPDDSPYTYWEDMPANSTLSQGNITRMEFYMRGLRVGLRCLGPPHLTGARWGNGQGPTLRALQGKGGTLGGTQANLLTSSTGFIALAGSPSPLPVMWALSLSPAMPLQRSWGRVVMVVEKHCGGLGWFLWFGVRLSTSGRGAEQIRVGH